MHRSLYADKNLLGGIRMSEPKKRGRPQKQKELNIADTDNQEEVETAIINNENKQPSNRSRRTPGDLVRSNSAKSADVSRILKNCMKWYMMPKVTSAEELRQRTIDFFTTCFEQGEIPTWEKYCLSTGYFRSTIWDWVTGTTTSELGKEANNIVKKAKDYLATFESELVTEGKVNPVVYIFRAKNYFGMKDQQEYLLTPKQPLGSDADPEVIAKKYQSTLPDATFDGDE